MLRACGRGNIEVVKALIKEGANVNANDKDTSPLTYAYDNKELVKLLTENGAFVGHGIRRQKKILTEKEKWIEDLRIPTFSELAKMRGLKQG